MCWPVHRDIASSHAREYANSYNASAVSSLFASRITLPCSTDLTRPPRVLIVCSNAKQRYVNTSLLYTYCVGLTTTQKTTHACSASPRVSSCCVIASDFKTATAFVCGSLTKRTSFKVVLMCVETYNMGAMAKPVHNMINMSRVVLWQTHAPLELFVCSERFCGAGGANDVPACS